MTLIMKIYVELKNNPNSKKKEKPILLPQDSFHKPSWAKEEKVNSQELPRDISHITRAKPGFPNTFALNRNL